MPYQTHLAKNFYRSYLKNCLDAYLYIIKNLPSELSAEQYLAAEAQFSKFGEEIILSIDALDSILRDYESVLHSELNEAVVSLENSRNAYNDYCAQHRDIEVEAARQALFIQKNKLNHEKITPDTKRYQMKNLDDAFALFLKSRPVTFEQIETEKKLFSDYYHANYQYHRLHQKKVTLFKRYWQLDSVIANNIDSIQLEMHCCFYSQKNSAFMLNEKKNIAEPPAT